MTLLFCGMVPSFVWAQAQQGTVILEGALVYKDADFDAPVISTLKAGKVYNISKGRKGPFYKIRLKPGMTGWISDTDIKPGIVKVTPPTADKKVKKEEPEKKRKPFFASRYRGPVLEMLNYTEDTLGEERSENVLFYGIKFNGYNTMFDGDIYTDANLLFHYGAPNFYSDTTGKQSEGYIVLLNFLLQTVLPQSKTHVFYYGFGPMFKYSHYILEVPNGASTITYSADDMNVGAVFDLGMAFRMGDFSLRTDVKYYWEKTTYYGLGLNLGWEF